MDLNNLLESLRTVRIGVKPIKEGDENNSVYTGATADEPKDIKSVVADICHQWDTLKLDSTFPDNVKVKLDGAIGTVNPGNKDAVSDADNNLKTDQATQKKEMAGDVQAVKDQDKFVPKVSETKIIGKTVDQVKKAEKTSNATGTKDAQQVKKDLAGDKKDLKNVSKETAPAKGTSKVK